MRLFDAIRVKLRGRAGETIAESLIALLISSLALTMLAGAIMASSNMIQKTRARIGNYYDQAEEVTNFKDNGDGATISDGTVTIAGQSISIKYAKNSAFARTPVVAFIKK